MRKTSSEFLDFPEEMTAFMQGHPYTGYSMEEDGGELLIRSFVHGVVVGMEFSIDPDSGSLISYMNSTQGGFTFGGLYEWQEGCLREERIAGDRGSVRVVREWHPDGSLSRDKRSRTINQENLQRDSGRDFVPWIETPELRSESSLNPRRFLSGVHPSLVTWDALGERFRFCGEAFWGHLVSATDQGRTRMRQILDGRNEGPVWEWAPSGKLVLQGVLHHPHGRVGPWHQWDETGRLARETVYDALGNRIIDRHFDETGNLTHEQHHEPTRLWTDPETGRQQPAPWLWF